MYAEVSLALSMTFSLIGAGVIMVLAVLMRGSRLEQKHLTHLDMLSLIPTLAVVLGLVAMFFALQDQTPAVVLLCDFGGRMAWFIAVGIGGLFAGVVVLYCLRAYFGNITGGGRKLLLSIAGVGALLFVCALGIAHMLVVDPSWNTLATPVQMLGFSLLGGSALAAMMLEKAGALGGTSTKRALMVFALLGVVLGAGGFAVQIVMVSNIAVSVGAGADLIGAASPQIVVSFFCLAATFIFEVMAIRMKETGFHSVIAVACAFVGVFCARLVFYALPIAGVV